MTDSTTAEVNGFEFYVEFNLNQETEEVTETVIAYKGVDVYDLMAKFAPKFIDNIDRQIGDAIRGHKNG